MAVEQTLDLAKLGAGIAIGFGAIGGGLGLGIATKGVLDAIARQPEIEKLFCTLDALPERIYEGKMQKFFLDIWEILLTFATRKRKNYESNRPYPRRHRLPQWRSENRHLHPHRTQSGPPDSASAVRVYLRHDPA